MSRSLVWLKRDLRLHDHRPLSEAADGPAAALWIIEPQWLASPEFHSRHFDFARACVAELRERLARRGLPLIVRVGDALEVLQALHEQHGFERLLSHEETGPGWTYARDLSVAAWCKTRGVVWQEFPQHGVVRRLRSRSGWAARWAARMEQPEVQMPAQWTAWNGVEAGALPAAADLGMVSEASAAPGAERAAAAVAPTDACTWSIAPGERAGLQVLREFLQGRGRGYRRALSSPLTAEEGCSRISAHLAFGALSLRRVHQRTEAAIALAREQGDAALASGLRGFSGRLRWHCHFMQKLEDEPAF